MAHHRAPGVKNLRLSVIIALIAMVMSVGLIWLSGIGRYTPAKVPATPQATSASVAPQPTSTWIHTNTPMPSSTSTPAVMKDPVGTPVRMRIARGKEIIVDFDKDPMVPTYLKSDNSLEPRNERVGWYAEPGWPLPGVLSEYRSVIVGHVTNRGEPDVFFNLPRVKSGDVIELHYPRQVLHFRVDQSFEVPKKDTQREDRVWESSGKAERVISVITCDPASETYTSGPYRNRLSGNWVVQATRIS